MFLASQKWGKGKSKNDYSSRQSNFLVRGRTQLLVLHQDRRDTRNLDPLEQTKHNQHLIEWVPIEEYERRGTLNECPGKLRSVPYQINWGSGRTRISNVILYQSNHQHYVNGAAREKLPNHIWERKRLHFTQGGGGRRLFIRS